MGLFDGLLDGFLGGIVDSVTSIGNTITGGLLGSAMDALGLDANKNFGREQMAWQSQENLLNRQFQSEEAEKARQYNTSERLATQEYNSAGQQVQRLREAGINPATAFGSGNSGVASQAMQQGALPQGSASISAPALFSHLQLASKGEFMKNLADAYKSTQEGTRVRELLGHELKIFAGEARSKQIEAEMKEMTANIVRRTGKTREAAEIENILMDAELKRAQAAHELERKNLTSAQYENALEERVGIIFDGVRKRFEASLGEAAARKAAIELKYYESRVREEIATMRSEQARNRAEASRASEQARYDKFTNDMRDKFRASEASAYIRKLEKEEKLSRKDAYDLQRQLDALSSYGEDPSTRDIDDFLRALGNAVGLNVGVHN